MAARQRRKNGGAVCKRPINRLIARSVAARLPKPLRNLRSGPFHNQ